MSREHNARIHWSEAQVARGLPSVNRGIDPAWFIEPGPGSDEGWSLRYEFASPPIAEGNPSTARVEFVLPGAPHERLQPGVWLELFERATRERARVEILADDLD
jgi:hypothetical protein